MRVVAGILALAALMAVRPAWADRARDSGPSVATNGAGTWLAVWASDDDLGGTIGDDTDILLSRSTDGGQTWSAPAALDAGAAVDTIGDGGPTVATDGLGTWIASWSALDTGSLPSTSILASRSTDDGVTWSTPTMLASGGVFPFPPIASDGAGTWIVGLGGPGIARSTDDGVTWAPSFSVDPGLLAKTGGSGTVATDGAGTWLVAWESAAAPFGGAFGGDTEPVYARSTDGGATWSVPAPLKVGAASDSGKDRYVRVAYDGLGSWAATWFNWPDSFGEMLSVQVTRSTDGGINWSPETAIVSQARPFFLDFEGLELASDGAGRFVLAYGTDGPFFSPGDGDLFFARSADAGATWSTPAPLNDASTDVGYLESNPGLAADGAGTWLAVWDSDDYLDGTIGLDLDILFARSTDDGTTWSSPAALSSTAPSETLVDVPVSARKLVVIDKRLVAGKAKVVYVSKDHAGGIDKGVGTDGEDVDGAFSLRYLDDSAAGAFVFKNWHNTFPNLWTANSDTLAKYSNGRIGLYPLAGTTRVAVVKQNTLLKFAAKDVGDRRSLDIVAGGAPGSSGIKTMFFIENGPEAFRHCTVFPGAECVHKSIAGGTGARLVCKNGVPAPCP